MQLCLSNFVQRASCPACRRPTSRSLGTPNFHRYFTVPAGKFVLDETTRKKRQLLMCTSCGLIYHQIVPTRDTINTLYADRTVLRAWSSPADTRRLRAKFKPIQDAMTRDGTVRVLDIGCHTGRFLRSLPRDWEKHGIDPNRIALDEAQQIAPEGKFRNGLIEEVGLPSQYFDVVTMWDVAEHLYDVGEAFSKVARTLKVGGYLVLETGNHFSLCARIFRSGWYYWNALEHFVFFNAESASALLEASGLNIHRITQTMHSTPSSRRDWVKAGVRTAIYALLTAGGRSRTLWSLTALVRNLDGAPAVPFSRDHILIVAIRTRASEVAGPDSADS